MLLLMELVLWIKFTADINDMELEGNPSYDKLNRGLPVTRAQTQGMFTAISILSS